MSAAIEIQNLTMDFPSPVGVVHALTGIDLTVPTGTVCGFLGPNGAGKTTTLNLLLGFLTPTAGSITVLGRTARNRDVRERVGYLPESPDPYRFLTGREFLRMTGRLFGIESAELNDRMNRLLDEVGLPEAADRRVATYSRGMVQRLGMAAALVNNPELVVLDEPTSGMDPLGRREIRRVIQTLREQGKTVLFSSHELSEVELVCDRVVILHRGRVVAEGGAHELAGDYPSLEQFFVQVVEGVE